MQTKQENKPQETELIVRIKSKPSALYNSCKALNNYDYRNRKRKAYMKLVQNYMNKGANYAILDHYIFIQLRQRLRNNAKLLHVFVGNNKFIFEYEKKEVIEELKTLLKEKSLN